MTSADRQSQIKICFAIFVNPSQSWNIFVFKPVLCCQTTIYSFFDLSDRGIALELSLITRRQVTCSDDQVTRPNSKLLSISLATIHKKFSELKVQDCQPSCVLMAFRLILSAMSDRLQNQSLPLGLWTARKSLSARNWKCIVSAIAVASVITTMMWHFRSRLFGKRGRMPVEGKREEKLSI